MKATKEEKIVLRNGKINDSSQYTNELNEDKEPDIKVDQENIDSDLKIYDPYNKERTIRVFKFCLPLLLLLIFNISYFLSLKGCQTKPLSVGVCLRWLKENGPMLTLLGIISCLMFVTLMIFMIHKFISYTWSIPAFGNLVFIWFIDGGTNFVNHGMMNRLIVIVGICIFLFIYFVILSIIFICRKGRTYIIITSAIILLQIFLLEYFFISGSCRDWENGIGHTSLNNNLEGECKLFVPSYCELSIRSGWFDINIFTQKCENLKMTAKVDKLNERIKSRPNLKRIGYPRIEDYSNKAIYNETYLQQIIQKDFIDMDDPEVAQNIKDNIEFILDVSNSDSHILHVELKKNETRAEEAEKLRQKLIDEDKVKENSQRIDKDVLIIYIDNISRPHFHRKLKKLNKWLSQYSEVSSINTSSDLNNSENKTNSKYDEPKLSMNAYEYFRLHSKASNTAPNINALFYGTPQQLQDEKEYVFRYFKDNGYIIGSFSDECQIDVLDINETLNYSEPFTRFDHLSSSLPCDQNYDSSGDFDIVLNKGRNTHYRRCMYGKSMHEIQLDYIMQFWDSYPDNRKAFRARFMESHEATGELIKYIDNDLVTFLEEFNTKGYLKNTIIYFIADHGAHFIVGHVPVLPDNSRFEENYLPMFLMLVPNDIPIENLQFLQRNQQHFMTGFDVYSSIKSIAVGKNANSTYTKSYSIIYEELPSNRDCDKNSIDYKFENCWCNMDYSITEKKANKNWIFYVAF